MKRNPRRGGGLPFWITHWPILLQKPARLAPAARLLRRCNIDVKGDGVGWWLIWLTRSHVALYVPRHQAHRAETTLKRYGYRIGGRHLT